ncbi:MAG: gephyrin-like molybdotransferase Glp [Sphingomonadales bacterium]
MITFEEALKRILDAFGPLNPENVEIGAAPGRALAEEIVAERSTPPADTSAMDGYAVRAKDLEKTPHPLKMIGEVPAGSPTGAEVKAGTTIRIFTGGIMPGGADTVVIQENTTREGDVITILKAPAPGANVRKAGMDFSKGDVLLKPGKVLNERDIALISAGNKEEITVYRRPRVVLLATGDELVTPGSKLGAGSVINTNVPTLAALLSTAGAEVTSPGILKDDLDAIRRAFEGAAGADIIVTLGGASVGDYDFVRDAFRAAGGTEDFWKIAMKPGKPLMFGDLGGTPVVGLPGNPVSAYVTAFLFLLPALRKLQGATTPEAISVPARAGGDLPATQDREVFMLARLGFSEEDGALIATPHPRQDSSRISTLQASRALIHRPANSKPGSQGNIVRVYPLPTH